MSDGAVQGKRLTLNGKPVGEQTGLILRSIRDVLAEVGAEDMLIPSGQDKSPHQLRQRPAPQPQQPPQAQAAKPATQVQPRRPSALQTPPTQRRQPAQAQHPANPQAQPQAQAQPQVQLNVRTQPQTTVRPTPGAQAKTAPAAERSRTLTGRLFGHQ